MDQQMRPEPQVGFLDQDPEHLEMPARGPAGTGGRWPALQHPPISMPTVFRPVFQESKQRCDKSLPCRRCQDRGISCRFRDDYHDCKSGQDAADLLNSEPNPIMESLSWEEPTVEGVVPSLSEASPFPGIGDSWLDSIPSMDTSDESLNFNDNEWINPTTPWGASSLGPTINGSGGIGFQLPRDLNAFDRSPSRSKRVTAKRLSLKFPKLNASDEEILTSEAFSHVPDISEGAYKRITDFYLDQCGWTETGELDSFPTRATLSALCQLYFEHFHPLIPVLHVPTFLPKHDTWILVIGIAVVGCQYSAISMAQDMAIALQELLYRALMSELVEGIPLQPSLVFCQAMLLHQLSLLASATSEDKQRFQLHRSTLAALCRPVIAREGFWYKIERDPENHNGTTAWLHWIHEESWNRLIYFTWSRLVILATFFVVEKSLRPVSSWDFKTRPVFAKDPDDKAAALDIEFQKLGCLSDGEDESAPSGRTLRKTYHLAFILRKVPLRILGMSFGYKATSQTAEMAREQLSRYFNTEARDAREILLHAATLSRIIREQTMITFLDPFWLLIASTYLQAYIRGTDLPTHNIQRDSSSRFYQPIRVDYNTSDAIRTRWV
ncbi:hypothetical protein FALBO_968 [Fusarium albosuccineum]|uniref:Xylanolytic transcriptional activator regulatory domain-containing protein n=1 Tax=Fusarium albosuccineum TaxID=1237068 RepID=A0A8H4PM61_9HYPO|nr:hypothetical protein FALBO_968 [Fusarium albosuccineum]